MVGPPSVYPAYGDLGRTWAPAQTGTGIEFIEVEMSLEMIPDNYLISYIFYKICQ